MSDPHESQMGCMAHPSQTPLEGHHPLEGRDSVKNDGALTQQHSVSLPFHTLPSHRPLPQAAAHHSLVLEHLQRTIDSIDVKVKHFFRVHRVGYQRQPHAPVPNPLESTFTWCDTGQLTALAEEELFQWFDKLNTSAPSRGNVATVGVRGGESVSVLHQPTTRPPCPPGELTGLSSPIDGLCSPLRNESVPPPPRHPTDVESALLNSLRILAEALHTLRSSAEFIQEFCNQEQLSKSETPAPRDGGLAPAAPTTAKSVPPRRKYSAQDVRQLEGDARGSRESVVQGQPGGGNNKAQRRPSAVEVPVVGVKELLRYKSLRLALPSATVVETDLTQRPTINPTDTSPLGAYPRSIYPAQECLPSKDEDWEAPRDGTAQVMQLGNSLKVSALHAGGSGTNLYDAPGMILTDVGAPIPEDAPGIVSPHHRSASTNIPLELAKDLSVLSSLSEEDQLPKAPLAVAQLHGTIVVDTSGSAVLCQFEILAELGKGNYGKVSLVMDANGELFALKTLRERKVLLKRSASPQKYDGGNKNSFRRNPQVTATVPIRSGGAPLSVQSSTDSPADEFFSQVEVNPVEQEIAVMKRLNHPNVVKLHAVIEDPEEGQTHLVMQYVDNGPIGKVATDNTCCPLPFTLALKYMAQVARGLEYLHSQNIIHRDIKPENILIGSDDTAYISDFGVSSIVADGDRPSGIMGTMSFFSPELLASHSALEQYGKESDVWAFGVTLYCLLFGKLPFTGKNGPELMRAILVNTIAIPDCFPPIPDIPTESGELGDVYPFLLRHRDDVSKTTTAIPVPQAVKDLLLGLLDRDPSSRITLRSFRSASVVRKPEKALRRLTHPPPAIPLNSAGAEVPRPNYPLEDAHRLPIDRSAFRDQQQQVHPHDEPLHFHDQPLLVVLPTALARGGHGFTPSPDSSSTSSSSTCSSFAFPTLERDKDVTDEERANAVIQCNVVLQDSTRRFSASSRFTRMVQN